MSVRHLKVKAVLDKTKKYFTLIVAEKSHEGEDFGPKDNKYHLLLDGSYGSISFRHKDLILYNWGDTSGYFFPRHEANLDWLSIPSEDPFPKKISSLIDVKYWPKIKALVEAYNEWGATQ